MHQEWLNRTTPCTKSVSGGCSSVEVRKFGSYLPEMVSYFLHIDQEHIVHCSSLNTGEDSISRVSQWDITRHWWTVVDSGSGQWWWTVVDRFALLQEFSDQLFRGIKHWLCLRCPAQWSFLSISGHTTWERRENKTMWYWYLQLATTTPWIIF